MSEHTPGPWSPMADGHPRAHRVPRKAKRMSARILTFRAPIRADPEDRLPPGPCIIGMVLVSIGLWYVGWIVWGWL